MAAGVRGFGAAAEKASQPVDDFVQSMSGKAFHGAATGAEKVADAISNSVVTSVVKGSKVMEEARSVFSEGGGEIAASFANLKNSAKGVFQQLVGSRLKKFAEQLPVDRFKAIGGQMKATVGIARGFTRQLFGMDKGLTKVARGASEASTPLQHVVSEDTAQKMLHVHDEVEHLAEGLGRDLPQSAKTGADRFRRSANNMADSESLISRGFGDVHRSADKAGGSVSKFAALGRGLISKFPVKQLGGLAKEMVNLAHTGGELTTGFEAQAQQASVDGRKAVAAYGIFGKALNQASGEAAGLIMGMKTSGQTAGAAVASFKQYSSVLKAVGIDSAAAGVKLEDGMNLPIRETTMQLHRMQTNLKLNDKQLGDLTRTLTGAGETIGDMRAPFSRLDEMLALAERRSNLVGQKMSSIGGADSVKSINRATQSLFILTGNAKGAQDTALSLENTMVNAMEGFRNMFTGTSDELDQFLVGTSIVTGDVQQAFEAAKDGPDAFIKKFGGVIAQLKKGGKSTEDIMKFFGGQMSKAMDPEAANQLVTALSNIDEEKLKLMNSAKAMGKSLGELGKESWRSSMTMQESFDLTVGAGLAAFRDIGRGAAVHLIKDTKSAFAEFNADAKKIVAKGGPLGTIVEKMSEISSIGGLALVPKSMRGTVTVFGELYKQLSPTLGAITQVGGALGALVNPVTLVAAAIGGFVALVVKSKNAANTWGDAIVDAVDKVKEFLDTWSQKILTWADQFDWDKVFGMLASGLASALEGLTRVFGALFGKKMEQSTEAVTKGGRKTFGGVASKIFTSLSEAFKKFQWGDLFSKLFDSMQGARVSFITKVAGFLKEAFKNTDEKTWESIGETIGRGIEKVVGFVARLIQNNPEVQSKINDMLLELGKMLVRALPALYEGLKHGLGASTTGTVILYLLNPLQAMADMSTFFMNLGTEIRRKISELWNDLKAQISDLGNVISPGGHFFGIDWGFLMDKAVAEIKQAWSAVKKPFEETFNWIQDTADKMFGHSTVPEAFDRGFQEITQTVNTFLGVIQGVFGTISKLAGGLFAPVTNIVDKIFGGTGSIANQVQLGMDNSLKVIKDVVSQVTALVQKSLYEAIVQGLTGAFVAAFSLVTKSTTKFFELQLAAFRKFLENILVMFRQGWTRVLDDTDMASQALAATIAGSLSDLEKLKAALLAAQQARAAAASASAESGKVGEKIQAESDVDKYKEQILNQTATPKWYTDLYQPLFVSKMDEVVNAVKGMRVAAVSPDRSAAAAAAARFRQAPSGIPGAPVGGSIANGGQTE